MKRRCTQQSFQQQLSGFRDLCGASSCEWEREKRQNAPLTPESIKRMVELLNENWEKGNDNEKESSEELA